MSRFRVLKAVSAFAALSALGACSEAPAVQKKADAPVIPKGIFISAKDCAAAGKLSGAECGKAIDAAVAVHQQTSKSYPSMTKCVAAEGKDRCDKTVDGHYRPRLQAFFVTMSKPPQAEPLYPPKKKSKSAAFRSAKQASIDASDEDLIVSASALSIAYANARLP